MWFGVRTHRGDGRVSPGALPRIPWHGAPDRASRRSQIEDDRSRPTWILKFNDGESVYLRHTPLPLYSSLSSRVASWPEQLRSIPIVAWNAHRNEERRPKPATTADDKSLGASGTRPPMNLPTAVATGAKSFLILARLMVILLHTISIMLPLLVHRAGPLPRFQEETIHSLLLNLRCRREVF